MSISNLTLNALFIVAIIIIGFGFTALVDFQDEPRSGRTNDPSTLAQTAPVFAKAPDVTLTTLDQNNVALSSFEGKTVMLNVWASWCAPCVVEFPQMLSLANKNEDLIFIALSVDENKAALERFLQKQNQGHLRHDNVIVAHDPDKHIAQDVFQVLKYPETIIISPTGYMVDKIVGLVDWHSPDIRTRLEKAAQN